MICNTPLEELTGPGCSGDHETLKHTPSFELLEFRDGSSLVMLDGETLPRGTTAHRELGRVVISLPAAECEFHELTQDYG